MKQSESKTPEMAKAKEKTAGQSMPDSAANLSSKMATDIERVRQREEKRLITLARKAGFFERRMSTAEISAMFKKTLENKKIPKRSQLSRLEDQMTTAKRRKTAQERKDDARRKILLGAFLMAQIAHRPDKFTWLAGELDTFLDTHLDASVAANNKLLMAEFLGARDR